MTTETLPGDYEELIEDLESQVCSSRGEAALAINREVIALYWNIGRAIVQREEFESWSSDVVRRVAKDLNARFPRVRGFSEENIRRMRAFFLAYTRDYLELAQPVREIDGINLPWVLAELPWSYNVVLVERLQEPIERLWYAQTALEYGWTRDVLAHQIQARLYEQQGKVPTNVERTVMRPPFPLTDEILADSHNRELLELRPESERKGGE